MQELHLNTQNVKKTKEEADDIPEISVVIPFYNCEEYVDELLNSMCGQSFSDTEILCVDDGSTDSTLALLREWTSKDGRVRAFSQEHRGAGAARNRGLLEAKGKYLAFPDADDSYQKDYLKELHDALVESDADIAVCWQCQENHMTGQAFHKLGFDPVRLRPGQAMNPKDVYNSFYSVSPHPHNKMWRRDRVIEKGLRFSETRGCNDQFFAYASLVSTRTIVGVDKELYAYRLYHNKGSISSHRQKYAADFLVALKELYQWLEQEGLLREYKSTYLRLWARDFRVAACNAEGEDFIKAVVETLMNEEPWRSMSDRVLQREAGLQTVIGSRCLDETLRRIRKNNGTVTSADKHLIKCYTREIENIHTVIRELQRRGRKVRSKVGVLRVGTWLLRDRGPYGVAQALSRRIFKDPGLKSSGEDPKQGSR